MANYELYVVQGKTLDNIAGTMKTILGVDKDAPIRFDEITNSDKTEQVNTDIETQAEIIAQIKTALDGKAGSSATELENLIDQSGVLGTTDGTATEKVEQLIEKANFINDFVEYFNTKQNVSVSGHSLFFNYKGNRFPPISFVTFANTQRLFGYAMIETFDYYIDCYSSTIGHSMFIGMSNLKSMIGVNTSAMTNVNSMFYGCLILETIQEPLDFSKVTNTVDAFRNCHKLKEIRFVAESIKVSISFGFSLLLSAESIQSIIDGLATVETAQTLTLHADVKAKLTQTQLDTITSKNWNLA